MSEVSKFAIEIVERFDEIAVTTAPEFGIQEILDRMLEEATENHLDQKTENENMKFIIVNTSGDYLVINKVSAHTTEDVYAPHWTSHLDRATIFSDLSLRKAPGKVIDKYRFKDRWNSEQVLDSIATTLEVEEIRTVRIAQPETIEDA